MYVLGKCADRIRNLGPTCLRCGCYLVDKTTTKPTECMLGMDCSGGAATSRCSRLVAAPLPLIALCTFCRGQYHAHIDSLWTMFNIPKQEEKVYAVYSCQLHEKAIQNMWNDQNSEEPVSYELQQQSTLDMWEDLTYGLHVL